MIHGIRIGPFLNCVGRSFLSCANLTTTYRNSWACGACGKEEESGAGKRELANLLSALLFPRSQLAEISTNP